MRKSKGELEIEQYLIDNNILYSDNFITSEGYKTDFYLPDYCAVIQHDSIETERTISIRKYCLKNKIHLIEIPYKEQNIIECLKKKLSSLETFMAEKSGKKSLKQKIQTKLYSWVIMFLLMIESLKKNKSKTSKKF